MFHPSRYEADVAGLTAAANKTKFNLFGVDNEGAREEDAVPAGLIA